MSKIMKQLEAEARAAREVKAAKPTPEAAASALPPLGEFELVWSGGSNTLGAGVGGDPWITVELHGGRGDGCRVTTSRSARRITLPDFNGGAHDYVFSGEYAADGTQIWEAL